MTITYFDLLLIWLFPLILCGSGVLFAVFLLYIFTLMPLSSLFKQDIAYKISKKKQLPSGYRAKWGYFYFLGLLILDNGVQATLLYRISHFFAIHHLGLLAEFFHSLSKFWTHIDISPYAEIGPGLSFYHGLGTVIGKFTRVGSRVTLCQGVTTGSGRPQIGDDVILWAGSKIIGNIIIGDRAEIGANAVVLDDVPSDCVVAGIPAKKIRFKHLPSPSIDFKEN